jgi:hypothetical protein
LKELASKASVGGTLPWVRIPPSPPVFLLWFHSVNDAALFVYVWRTLRFEERHRILSPSPSHIRLGLFLTGSHPRDVRTSLSQLPRTGLLARVAGFTSTGLALHG